MKKIKLRKSSLNLFQEQVKRKSYLNLVQEQVKRKSYLLLFQEQVKKLILETCCTLYEKYSSTEYQVKVNEKILIFPINIYEIPKIVPTFDYLKNMQELRQQSLILKKSLLLKPQILIFPTVLQRTELLEKNKLPIFGQILKCFSNTNGLNVAVGIIYFSKIKQGWKEMDPFNLNLLSKILKQIYNLLKKRFLSKAEKEELRELLDLLKKLSKIIGSYFFDYVSQCSFTIGTILIFNFCKYYFDFRNNEIFELFRNSFPEYKRFGDLGFFYAYTSTVLKFLWSEYLQSDILSIFSFNAYIYYISLLLGITSKIFKNLFF